ncbi:DEAD/DEAH box helicase family protein, partial [Acinetobacter junii]
MDLKNILVANKLWSHLRTCQQNSIDKASTYLNNPVSKKSCLISLPTGAGKTGVICTLAHFSEQKRILVLCHRRAVCDQLFKQLRGEFFIKISPEGTFNKKNVFDNVDDSTADGIYVSTFQKLRSMASADLATLKEKVDLLIIDEGHSEPSPVWSQLARNLNAHKIIITATPYRNDLFQFDIDPSVSYIHTFKQSIEDGILSDPTFSTINESILVARVQELLAEQPKTKCIVKCDKFENIEYFFELFSKSFRTLAIHEQYAKDKRPNVKADVPAKIDKSDWEVLVHQRKLDEGVDIPQAKILVLTYTVRSGRELVQTVGRVVRLHQEYNANVLELDGIANSKIWNNYRNFDEYIDNPTSGKKFLNSLNTAGLIDRYLEAFPDISYFGSGFKRKFNLKEFDPVQ